MRFWIIAAALAAAGCAAQSAPRTLTCAAERAVYLNRAEPGARLRVFKPPHAQSAASDLAAIVDFEGERYWFAFTASQGYSRNYIGRTGDMIEAARREDSGEDADDEHREPEFDGSEISFFDASYGVIETLPQTGAPAPAHIYASGIGSAIWYSIPRRSIPIAMWDLAECAPNAQL
ncbi:MAG: hypothetical protein WDM79_02980 [Terricaulis sp.]